MIPIEIAYASQDQQVVITLVVAAGSTIDQAIAQSGILSRVPEIVIHNNVGIFGKPVALSQAVTAGDRIEIYRPLKMDPKQARVLRHRSLSRHRDPKRHPAPNHHPAPNRHPAT